MLILLSEGLNKIEAGEENLSWETIQELRSSGLEECAQSYIDRPFPQKDEYAVIVPSRLPNNTLTREFI